MKLKIQSVFDATPVIAAIINRNAPMGQKGKYRVARLHAKLLPEFKTIAERRDALILAYDHKNEDDQASVPEDKMPEFAAAWSELAADEIEVDVQPIPLACLDLGDSTDGAITALEMITLGDLVAE